MKNISKILCTFIFTFLLFNINVNAIELNANYTVSGTNALDTGLDLPMLNHGTTASFVEEMPYNSVDNYSSYYTSRYSYSTGSGYIPIYCIDPNLRGSMNVTVSDLLLAEDSDSEEYKAYEAGLVAILSNGFTGGSEAAPYDGGSISGQNYYYATMLAIRSYALGFWNKGNNSSYSWETHAAVVINYGIYWAENIDSSSFASTEVKEAMDVLQEKGYDKTENAKSATFRNNRENTYFTNLDSNGTGLDIMQVAQALYYEGIKAAGNYVSGNEIGGTISSPTVHESKMSINEEGFRTVTRTYTMQATDFTKGKLTEFNINVPASEDMKAEIEYYVNGEKVDSLVGLDLSNNPKIEAKMLISALKMEDCQDLNYTIDYAYEVEGESQKGQGGLLTYGNAGEFQRFLIFDPNADNNDNANNKNNISQKINLCPKDCSTKMNVTNECVESEDGEVADAGSITGTTNILSCVVDGIDDAGNSYTVGACAEDEMKEAVDSPYCSISCKEDYTSIKFPPIQDATQGRYFRIGAEIDATKTCYTDKIDIDLYNENVDEIINSASSYEEAKRDIEAETAALNACSTWSLDYSKNPTIKYTYDSVYFDLIEGNSDATELKSNNPEVELNTWACNGTVDEKYGTCTGSNTNGIENKTINYNGQNITVSINTADYYKVSGSKEILYTNNDVFYNVYPSGEIVFGKPEGVEATVVDGLPIAFDLTEGSYNFNFQLDGLGEYYSDCTTGRLVDADTDRDSVDDVLPEDLTYEGDYECYYRVPCLVNCDVSGEIEFETTPCPNCMVEVGDLYFRTYSSNNFNPNDRDLGYNWSYDYDVNDKFGFVAEKANVTYYGYEEDDLIVEGLETIGDKTYDKEPILSVTLTPNLAREIKSYNNDKSYTNNTLTCYDYNDTYQNTYCYSKVLDDWSNEYSENFVFAASRSDDVYSRQENNTEYFIPFVGDNTQIPEPSPTNIGGPSWK